jgi:hypothetical protein
MYFQSGGNTAQSMGCKEPREESPLKVNHGESLKSITAPKSQM